VAIVERLLPRHWDGRRLLQFLAGLALLAMSFALRADVVATPAAVPASAGAAASVTVSVTAAVRGEALPTEALPTETDHAEQPAVTAVAAMAGVAPAAASVVVAVEPARMLDRVSPHDAGPRAPPLA
jgi:hypothetical protein